MTDRYYYRDMPSVRYYEGELAAEFVQFIDDEILPRIKLSVYKSEEKRATVRYTTLFTS
jgi:hypothetical protein